MLILTISLISFAVNYFPLRSNLNNLLWFLFTYGSVGAFGLGLLFLQISWKDLLRLLRFGILITFIQTGLGYWQMVTKFSSWNPFSVSSAAGDYFTGTLWSPGLAHLAALKISLVFLFFLPFWLHRKTLERTIILVLLTVGWFLPSALYSIALATLALLTYYVLLDLPPRLVRLKSSRSVAYLSIVVGLGLVAFVYTQRSNIGYFRNTMEKLALTIKGESSENRSARKIEFYQRAFVDLPIQYPHSVLLGVGPANFSSRSSWIVSGLYIQPHPEYIPKTPSLAAESYTIPFYQEARAGQRLEAGSIVNLPFASWISIYAELGIFALLIVAALLFKLYIPLSRTNGPRTIKLLAIGNNLIVIYLGFLMLVENVLEYPQLMNQFLMISIPLNLLLRTNPDYSIAKI